MLSNPNFSTWQNIQSEEEINYANFSLFAWDLLKIYLQK